MVDETLTLYAYNFTSRAERVIWCLAELGLDYELIRLDPFKGDIFKPEFLELNPNAKVPVLVHGEKIYTESLAIMEYLNGLVADVQLVPEGGDDQSRYRHLIYYMATEIETYLWICDQANRLKDIYPWPEGTTEVALKRVGRNIKTVFQKVLENDFAAGKNFSIADIYAWQLMGWAGGYGIELPDDIQAYMNRMMEREGFPEGMKGNPNVE